MEGVAGIGDSRAGSRGRGGSVRHSIRFSRRSQSDVHETSNPDCIKSRPWEALGGRRRGARGGEVLGDAAIPSSDADALKAREPRRAERRARRPEEILSICCTFRLGPTFLGPSRQLAPPHQRFARFPHRDDHVACLMLASSASTISCIVARSGTDEPGGRLPPPPAPPPSRPRTSRTPPPPSDARAHLSNAASGMPRASSARISGTLDAAAASPAASASRGRRGEGPAREDDPQRSAAGANPERDAQTLTRRRTSTEAPRGSTRPSSRPCRRGWARSPGAKSP